MLNAGINSCLRIFYLVIKSAYRLFEKVIMHSYDIFVLMIKIRFFALIYPDFIRLGAR